MKEKHPGGRPRLFKTSEEIEEAISDYFEGAEGKFTITGLAYYLGFESRQSFYDYEEKSEFSYVIKRARLMVEFGYERRLSENNVAGAIFALKNMGWKDQTQTDITSGGEKIQGFNYIQPKE